MVNMCICQVLFSFLVHCSHFPDKQKNLFGKHALNLKMVLKFQLFIVHTKLKTICKLYMTIDIWHPTY